MQYGKEGAVEVGPAKQTKTPADLIPDVTGYPQEESRIKKGRKKREISKLTDGDRQISTKQTVVIQARGGVVGWGGVQEPPRLRK